MRPVVVIKLSGRVFGMDSVSDLDRYAASFSELAGQFQCVVVAGGGRVARHYIEQARKFGADEATADEIGIDVSRLNARLLISALGRLAYPYPPSSMQELADAVRSGDVVVAGGLYPGQSTNGTAALMAEKISANKFINATDVDGVYNADPRKITDARLLDTVHVGKLRQMLASATTSAGGYDLMDLVALKVIERSSIDTAIIRATPQNVERAVRGQCIGTRIIH